MISPFMKEIDIDPIVIKEKLEKVTHSPEHEVIYK
jgi:hypothetical protein